MESEIVAAFIAIIGTLILFLLGMLLADTREIKRDVKTKVDKDNCEKERKDIKSKIVGYYDALHKHGHSENGRVIRGS